MHGHEIKANWVRNILTFQINMAACTGSPRLITHAVKNRSASKPGGFAATRTEMERA